MAEVTFGEFIEDYEKFCEKNPLEEIELSEREKVIMFGICDMMKKDEVFKLYMVVAFNVFALAASGNKSLKNLLCHGMIELATKVAQIHSRLVQHDSPTS